MTKQVTVYSKPDCMQCNFTKKWLTEHSIKFNSIDVTQDRLALSFVKDQLGYQTVPVVVVDELGSELEHWHGFQPDKLAELVD
ncbi:glutaredoxin family protein [Aerococcus urinaeequi]